MKLFTIRRLLGFAAIYGAVRYARRHGGARRAFNDLLDKAKEMVGPPPSTVESTAKAASNVAAREPAPDSRYGSYGGYGGYSGGSSGSGGMGGGGNNAG